VAFDAGFAPSATPAWVGNGSSQRSAVGRLEQQLAQAVEGLHDGLRAHGGPVTSLQAGRNTAGDGLVINSSRAILYAGGDADYAGAAARVARETRDQINEYRHT